MANIKPGEHDSFPKTGRVTEVCKEWSVREDGALAYRLQNEEITGHLQSNRYRNAVVRQDFPCALDEQLREQQLAEQAAAVYHQMLAEQEEIDNLYAKQLANKIENEEKLRRRTVEVEDEQIVAHLVENEIVSNTPSSSSHYNSPQKLCSTPLYNANFNQAPFRQERSSSRRQALAMPLPDKTNNILTSLPNAGFIDNMQDHYVYTEPYRANNDLANQLDRIDIAELGVPLEETGQRAIQEQKDALLARKLQQQEDSSQESQLNRDRLLAIEAQDKELAKLLQERERQKAKRAKERAKQKALAKKQLQSKEQDVHQIMPDDSYSNPADLLPSPHNSDLTHNLLKQPQHQPDITNHTEDDFNYSFPVDVLPSKNYSSLKQNYDSKFNQDTKILNAHCSTLPEKLNAVRTPVRPTQLDLKFSNNPNKVKYSELEFVDNPSQHVNIAMAIDPTYTRRNHHGTTYYDTSSGTVTTSTSSSSPGITLPPLDTIEHESETSPVPPYMPIQGQRRTASLEKKSKKKSKDACKQQ